MKPFREWTVLPHGKLTPVDENILAVTGMMHMPPMGQVERRMTLVRLADARLIVWSAIALDEAGMQSLERFGTPAYLIVPGDLHRLDAKIWKDRYPALRVIAPMAAREKVEQVVPVNATSVDFGDPTVSFLPVPGTGDQEAALVVEGKTGTTLVLNDLIFDLTNRPGISGWLFKAIGMTGDEPHIPSVIKLRKIKNKSALRGQLHQWSQLPNLQRVIISHGNIIATNAPQTLRRIAESLLS
jgi:hypothetical protein